MSKRQRKGGEIERGRGEEKGRQTERERKREKKHTQVSLQHWSSDKKNIWLQKHYDVDDAYVIHI